MVTSKFLFKKFSNEIQAAKKNEEAKALAKKLEQDAVAARKLEAKKLAEEVLSNERKLKEARKAAQDKIETEQDEYYIVDDKDLKEATLVKSKAKFFLDKLGEDALVPSLLNLELSNKLKELGFKSIKDQQFLLKDNEESVMFVASSSCDIDPSNVIEFARAGNRDIEASLKDIVPHLKSHYELLGKVEVFIPYAITKGLFGFKRAHWIYVHLIIKENTVFINFIDSKSSTYGYDYTQVTRNIELALGEFKNFQSNIITTSHQSHLDHTSCGHYVIKYIADHASLHYPIKEEFIFPLKLEETNRNEVLTKNGSADVCPNSLLLSVSYSDYLINEVVLLIEDVKDDIKNENKDEINNHELLYDQITMLRTSNLIIDFLRVIHAPTVKQSQTLIRDVIHLQNIFQGTNYYSLSISLVDVLNQFYLGEYKQGFIYFSEMIGYLTIPTIFGSFSDVYTVVIADYLKYVVFDNIYTFLSEYNSLEFQLKFSLSYGELFHHFGLEKTSKQLFTDAKDIIENSIKQNDSVTEVQHIAAEYKLTGRLIEYDIECDFC